MSEVNVISGNIVAELEPPSSHNDISVIPQSSKKCVRVNGKQVTYIEQGSGDPIVFIHGGFGSALVWRKLLPLMSHAGRCIAIDLPGYGDSAPVSQSTNVDQFIDLQREAFGDILEALGVTDNITLFVHGITGMSVLDWVFRNSDSIKAVAHAAVCFVDNKKEAGLGFLCRRRTPGAHELFLNHGYLIGKIVKRLFGGKLPEDVLTDFLRPMFGDRETRSAIAGYIFNVPSYGEPLLEHDRVLSYTDWLRHSPIPKLRIKSAEITEDLLKSYQLVANDFLNQKDVVVEGGFFLPEENPVQLANALLNWFDELDAAR